MVKHLLSSVALAPLALGQALYGRALPANVPAPSTAGFQSASVGPSRGGGAVCVSGLVNVAATTSKNIKFTLTPPTNQSTVTDVTLQAITQGSSFMQQIMGGTQTVSGNYTIGATLCTPAGNTKPSKVQLLTHGIGFDRHYWDFAPDYSYVDKAAANGYATFFYDRLGVGQSAKPDPLQDIQVFIEIEIAAALARALKAGAYGGCGFSSVVGVGHSFGSVISEAVTAEYPDLFSAAILTGFSVNSSAIPLFLLGGNFQIARENNPYRFSNLSTGFLVGGSAIATQINFARAPNFDPAVLALAYATGGTVTFGELFTVTAGATPAKTYSNPVAVVNGDNDLPFCTGNCSYPTNLAQAVFPALYPSVPASKTGTYLAPLTGHGLNLHFTAPAAFDYIFSFLKAQGV
ncbi:alpha/beta-hydrolase [Myriangium duriaei CBS 260.36]|uniref:Alpha/beta-hydrolase n=1 Tax=Myriangium duriaei CBS 260.36 TaxID=1168546 RepID=A0A9P4J268_9PEZI|nr:alpha/beta-hydrolase [Myriangium duriaei CBS 260.36]